MITARDLLREVEKLLAQARERSERHVENGVFKFMQVWVLSGHLEESLLSEMRRFPDIRIKNLIDCPPYPAAGPFSLGSNNPPASPSGGRQPKKVLGNIASMGSQEIVDLSQALRNLEVENYTLQSAIQTLATWKDKKQASFVPFAEQVSSLWFLTPQHS